MDNRESVVVGSSQADVQAAEAVERHHAEMAGRLGVLVGAVRAAAVAGDAGDAAREELVGWLRADLVPHALAEEEAMYPAARATVPGRLLVEGMLAEHETVTRLVEEVAAAPGAVEAAAAGYALQVLFESHLRKENELVLPLLVETPGVSVADLLAGMHELLGGEAGHERAGEAGCGGHACGCGEVDGPGYPELDARTVPHAIRHATVFGALDTVGPGGGLVLVAPHDPLPLLAQVEQRTPGRFTTDYLERGPEAWRLQFVRR